VIKIKLSAFTCNGYCSSYAINRYFSLAERIWLLIKSTLKIYMAIAAMNDKSSWYEATVNFDDEYFTLYHNDTSENSDNNKSSAVAKLGYWQWQEELFPVEFLTDNQTLITKVAEQLDFYLNKLPHERKDTSFADTWHYAKYHCGTSANIYSDIQWAYFPVKTNKSLKNKSRNATSLPFFQKCQTIIHTHYKNLVITLGLILPFLQPKTSPWWVFFYRCL